MVAGSAFVAFAEDDTVSAAQQTQPLSERISNLSEKKAQYQKILEQNAKETADKQAYNTALTEKIKTLSEKVTLTREEISNLSDSISSNQKEIDQANDDIEGQLEAVCDRLRSIYMAGTASELEIILGAKSFGDMIDKVNLVKSLSKYDEELIQNLSDKLDEIETKQTQLSKDREQMIQDEADLDADLEDLNKTLKENEETLKKLDASTKEAQNFLASADTEQSMMEAQIRAYFEEQAKNSDYIGTGGYVWPAPGFYYLSSLFKEDRTSYFHGGIDIAGGGIMGTPVLAADTGTVVGTFTGCTHNWGKETCCACGSYGNYVWMNHGNGKETIYGHLTSVAVQPGDSVKKGQVIGFVGSTGNSTGPHLHFECRMGGVKYDPMTEF